MKFFSTFFAVLGLSTSHLHKTSTSVNTLSFSKFIPEPDSSDAIKLKKLAIQKTQLSLEIAKLYPNDNFAKEPCVEKYKTWKHVQKHNRALQIKPKKVPVHKQSRYRQR